MTVKITLRAARVNVGLSRKEAAKRLDIHYETLTKYENDSTNVPKSFCLKLESVFGIPEDYLFFGKEEDYIKWMNQNLLREVNTIS